MTMRNACLGATFKGNVIETRCAASQTGTVIILDLLPRSREVLRIFQFYSKTFIGDVFLNYASALVAVFGMPRKILYSELQYENRSQAPKGLPNSRLYGVASPEQTERPQVSTCATALETGV